MLSRHPQCPLCNVCFVSSLSAGLFHEKSTLPDRCCAGNFQFTVHSICCTKICITLEWILISIQQRNTTHSSQWFIVQKKTFADLYTKKSGLSKVVGCRQKSQPTWCQPASLLDCCNESLDFYQNQQPTPTIKTPTSKPCDNHVRNAKNKMEIRSLMGFLKEQINSMVSMPKVCKHHTFSVIGTGWWTFNQELMENFPWIFATYRQYRLFSDSRSASDIWHGVKKRKHCCRRQEIENLHGPSRFCAPWNMLM